VNGASTTTSETATSTAAARRRVALACRILASAGLMEDVLGHVSVRIDDHRVLVRARGPAEAGLLFTSPDDVVACDLDGGQLDDGSGRTLPNELPIHLACYASDPSVAAVVHAHPPAVIAADLAGIPLVPMIGAYHIPAARLAADGIPTYPRSVLINTPKLGREMRAVMGDRPVCVLRGHGITTTGTTLEQAVGHALAIDALARMACRVTAIGGHPTARPADELDQLPDLGASFNDEQLWRFHVRRLELAGLGLGEDAP
jgi:ribulose-5-phosphate 4-epimerase/fuculose-1-phosphate aldolase